MAAGVLLASAIMSGTVIYFDSLRDLALQNILAKLTTGEANILAKADRGPTSFAEYEKVSRAVNEQVDSRLAWFLRDRIPGGKTATFFLTGSRRGGQRRERRRQSILHLPVQTGTARHPAPGRQAPTGACSE